MSATIVGGTFNNPERLVQKLEKAFEAWARFEVNDYFRDQFLEDKWDYPGETQRKSGEFVGPEPRNIFDLGELYRSGRDSFDTEKTINGINASWNWDAKNSSGKGYACTSTRDCLRILNRVNGQTFSSSAIFSPVAMSARS